MENFYKRMIVLLLIPLLSSMIFVSCGPGAVEYMSRTHFDLVNKDNYEQAKGGITIMLKPLDDKVGIYTPTIKLSVKRFLKKRRSTVEKKYKINYFNKMLPFEVKIINNTKHIIRMRDARIVYIDPDMDEPIMALDKSQILNNVEELPIYEGLVNTILNNHRMDEIYSDVDNVAERILIKKAKKLKFINGFNREIMPGMRRKGIILFNIDPKTASEGKVSFIDMTSEVDNAGNPTKKVRFDYRVKPITKHYKYDPNTNNWEEIKGTGHNQASYDQNNTTFQERNNYKEETTVDNSPRPNYSNNNSDVQKAKDIVYFKNGSTVKGIIVKEVPNTSVDIKKSDGNIYQYRMDEILKITKEKNISNETNDTNYSQSTNYSPRYSNNFNSLFSTNKSYIGPSLGLSFTGSAVQFGANYEYGMNQQVGLGGIFRYWSYGTGFWSYTNIVIGVQGNYHFKISSAKIDPYVGVILAYNAGSSSWDNSYWGNSSYDYGGSSSSDGSLWVGVQGGARYWFSPSMAANARLVLGTNSALDVGIDFRF